jgi:hypothetical protein
MRVHVLNDAEIVVDFQRARLDALATRAGAMVRRRGAGLDNTDSNAAPRQIARQHQARRSCAGDQHVDVRHDGSPIPGAS